uniref:Uncharacterized protein n=1 Tax=Oryza punctata TaxID=4537 RepID=A0A0E0LHY6_ORYPU
MSSPTRSRNRAAASVASSRKRPAAAASIASGSSRSTRRRRTATCAATGAIARVHLPIFSDHCVLDSIDGVLLLERDHDTSIRLLHPFTGDIADFPPLDTLLPYVSHSLMGDKWFRLRNVEAAAISVATGGVVSLTMWVFGMVYVSFATSGDKQWRVSTNKLENDEQFLRSIIIPRQEQGTDKLSGRNQGVAGEKKVEKGGARKQLPFYAGDAWFSFRDRHYVDFSTGKVVP